MGKGAEGGWLLHPRRSMFRDVEWQEAAQGLGCKPFLAERHLHAEVRITAFMGHVYCMFILLAKQLPSWGNSAAPPCKRIIPAGLVDCLHFHS